MPSGELTTAPLSSNACLVVSDESAEETETPGTKKGESERLKGSSLTDTNIATEGAVCNQRDAYFVV